MRLEAHTDARAFLAAAHSVLAADEPRHNLIYGICSTLIENPAAYAEASFWTVEAGRPVAALLMTPPYNVAVARPLHEDALAFAAERLRADGVRAPGVTGAVPEVESFARAWTDTPRLRMSQGIYAAREIRMPGRVSGKMRLATLEDADVVVEYVSAFQDEVIPDDSPHVEIGEAVERRLRSDTAGMALWEDEGRVVSLCGFGGRTPHGIRIGPVYTPPELRGRGYGSAVTAAASQSLLDREYEFCFLYTDLANPTSNKIYMDIGYERVCESADYAFGA